MIRTTSYTDMIMQLSFGKGNAGRDIMWRNNCSNESAVTVLPIQVRGVWLDITVVPCVD